MAAIGFTQILRKLSGLLLAVSIAFNATSQPSGAADSLKNFPEPGTILQQFVRDPDSAYHWKVTERLTTKDGIFIHLTLFSQIWRGTHWKHSLYVFFPTIKNTQSTGFLSLQMEFSWEHAYVGLLQAAQATGTPCAILCDVPNQPLFGGRTEEELLNYTFEQYLQTGEPSWPLLLPMVKSTVRAMDALQELCKQQELPFLEHFIVAGHSKRGHTAWLSAAMDKRVTGLIAQGFNTLNAPVQIPHYLSVYGALDQSALAAKKVIEQINTVRGQNLIKIIDAYSYRERLTMPKLVIIGTNDDYTPVDALNMYWPGLTGPKSVLSLIGGSHVDANGDSRLFPTAYAFIREVADGKTLPDLMSSLQQANDKIKVTITASGSCAAARIWEARSPNQDFRQATWIAKAMVLNDRGAGKADVDSRQFTLELDAPQSGYVTLIGEVEFNG